MMHDRVTRKIKKKASAVRMEVDATFHSILKEKKVKKNNIQIV